MIYIVGTLCAKGDVRVIKRLYKGDLGGREARIRVTSYEACANKNKSAFPLSDCFPFTGS